MSPPRTQLHILFCPDPGDTGEPVPDGSGAASPALYAWVPKVVDGAEPPRPVRAALWAGLMAVSDQIGFMSARQPSVPGSVWCETPQGTLARWLHPLPGMLWTREARTFDRAFSEDWVRGGQVLWALDPEAGIPDVGADLLLRWIRTVALDMPSMPDGVGLAVRSGTGGGLFTVSAPGPKLLERFGQAFRTRLDERTTTFRQVRAADLAETLARAAASHSQPETALPARWLRQIRTERTRR